MEHNPVPKTVRRLVILSAAFLIASLLMSGYNVFTTLAAPLEAPFVPSTVGFEGLLTDGNGDPVSDGDYTITFSLYDQSSAGTALWTESQSVSVTNGLYSVQLGSVTALDAADFEGDRWLGVQVSGDSEMTPRIAISAVPFALNAQQAMGLQGYDVTTTAPDDGEVLTWDDTNEYWEPDVPGARTFPELTAVDSNEDPQDFFNNYRQGVFLRYVDSDTIEASAGELMINGYMRKNTSAVDVEFDPDTGGTGPNLGLDTGSAQANTTYYIYAVADDAESTFDLIISTSSSAPTGPTYYRLLGDFDTNDSTSPIEIKNGSVANTLDDVRTLKIASGEYTGDQTNDRLIEVGFQPHAVLIMKSNIISISADNWWLNDAGTLQTCLTAEGTMGYCSAYVYIDSFVSNGFNVDVWQNASSAVYRWIAWGY